MIAGKRELIANELAEGTGAGISISIDDSTRRTALKIWFSDLGEKSGPIAELRPHGLRGHKVEVFLGTFAASTATTMNNAAQEDQLLARALLQSIRQDANLEVDSQPLHEWDIKHSAFAISAILKHDAQPNADAALTTTCREIIVPIMAAMAELIGYDEIPPIPIAAAQIEGALSQSLMSRRERNPRNRLLCIRIHGERCLACDLAPKHKYGPAGSIIEVHHLEPLSTIAAPKRYDPASDLVPLCANCHRAIHTRKPTPWTLEELKQIMREQDAQDICSPKNV